MEKRWYQSKKFIMAIVGVIAIALHGMLGIQEEAILEIAGVIVAYLVGQGYVDGKTRSAAQIAQAATHPTQGQR